MDTSEGCISRVARYLAQSPNDTIDTVEFRTGGYACGVEPDSFTQSDLERLRQKLRNLG